MVKKRWLLLGLIFLAAGCISFGRGKGQRSYTNQKVATTTTAATNKAAKGKKNKTKKTTLKKEKINKNAIIKGTSTYNCDLKKDKANFDGHVDITVGDNYYAAQINDWYMYFDQYEGETVEIEGYYIGDYSPYIFIGRHGPVCPYCHGGFVSFEILTDADLSKLQSQKDWIRVKGILRQGIDSAKGPFYYIEVLDLEKMPQAGKATVTN